MSAPAREYSLDHHLLERFRFSGIERENLADLVSIVVGFKNKYGIVPFAASALGSPLPSAIVVHYFMDSITLHKTIKILLETPRLHSLTVTPLGIPRTAEFEIAITLGG